MRKTSLLPLLALLAAAGCAASSGPCGPGATPCRNLADVEIVDRDSGEHLPVYWKDGQRWVAGTPGHRYSVTLRNRTAGRVMTVVSVDGVNVLSGETADVTQGGYVLRPWQSFDVLGWRKSLDNVADFVFTSVPDSYAARTGRPENVGVIGVAVYSEAPPPAPPVGVSHLEGSVPQSASGAALGRAQADAAPAVPPSAAAEATRDMARKAAPAVENRLLQQQLLGTGHGQIETSVVMDTNFELARPAPEQIVTIRYDRRDRLVAMGIVPPPLALQPAPRAFPAAASQGFVADPPR